MEGRGSMSLNFTVYPNNRYIPTYKELLEYSNDKINNYLISHGIKRKIMIDYDLKNIKKETSIKFSINDEYKWREESYVEIYIKGISGMAASYFYNEMNEFEKEAWIENINSDLKYKKMEKEIRKSIEIGYNWIFKRSAGQPGVIVLIYGFFAASLAKLTDGIIYSDDGGWNYELLPAKAEDFFRFYLNSSTANNEYKEFTKNTLKLIRKELGDIGNF